MSAATASGVRAPAFAGAAGFPGGPVMAGDVAAGATVAGGYVATGSAGGGPEARGSVAAGLVAPGAVAARSIAPGPVAAGALPTGPFASGPAAPHAGAAGYRPARGTRVRAAAAAFWLAAFFCAAERSPRLIAVARRPFCRVVFFCSPWIRRGTLANARRLLGPGAAERDVVALARRTLASFYLFCCDVGRSFGRTRADLLAQVESVEGHAHYVAARAAGRGVIVVTAHMGSFEVGMAALRDVEPNAVHVVFRRDRFERFEHQRSALRARLGVREAPVDEGWTVWVRLRDALLADDAVVLQGDRVMPGQKGEGVSFLGGTLLLPAGPVKLALATGAPIIPIFSVRTPAGKVKLFIEPAIEVGDRAAGRNPHPALLRWATLLERYVKTYPDQWLLLQPALVEDAEASTEKSTPSPGTPGEGGGEGPSPSV